MQYSTLTSKYKPDFSTRKNNQLVNDEYPKQTSNGNNRRVSGIYTAHNQTLHKRGFDPSVKVTINKISIDKWPLAELTIGEVKGTSLKVIKSTYSTWIPYHLDIFKTGHAIKIDGIVLTDNLPISIDAKDLPEYTLYEVTYFGNTILKKDLLE